MPLTEAQRRQLDAHIRSNTIYHWHAFGADSTSGRGYIISSIERVVDSQSESQTACQRDLFLPNCFIDGCENSRFWFKMAAIVCGYEGPCGWHEVEFGVPINREDLRQRYVYTWGFKGGTYKFYTKTLRSDCGCELVWYFGKSAGEDEDVDSGDETEDEDILLRVHP